MFYLKPDFKKSNGNVLLNMIRKKYNKTFKIIKNGKILVKNVKVLFI